MEKMKEVIKKINFKVLSVSFAVFLLIALLCISIFSEDKTDQPLAKKVSVSAMAVSDDYSELSDVKGFTDSKIKLSLKSSINGFTLEYTAVQNSTNYEVYRKTESETEYTLVASTDKTEYLDGTVKSGETYVYEVKAVLNQDESHINGVYSNKVEKKFVKFDKNKKMVALTFDDGPDKYTSAILKCLDKYDAHATFFVLGSQVKKFKSDVKNAHSIGCEIGSHTYDHINLTLLSKKGIKKQINKTDDLLEDIIGHGATLVRPPYGYVNSNVKKLVNKPIITWNVDTRDWQTKSEKSTYKNVMKEVSDGDIILMHDIHEPTKNAVLKIILELKKQGYQIVTVSEMAEYKGITLKNGKVYREFN